MSVPTPLARHAAVDPPAFLAVPQGGFQFPPVAHFPSPFRAPPGTVPPVLAPPSVPLLVNCVGVDAF
jgi:hypothetical protein